MYREKKLRKVKENGNKKFSSAASSEMKETLGKLRHIEPHTAPAQLGNARKAEPRRLQQAPLPQKVGILCRFWQPWVHDQSRYWCRIQTVVFLLPLMQGSRRWQNYPAGVFLYGRQDENIWCCLLHVGHTSPPQQVIHTDRLPRICVWVSKGKNSTSCGRQFFLGTIRAGVSKELTLWSRQTQAVHVLTIGTPAAAFPSQAALPLEKKESF